MSKLAFVVDKNQSVPARELAELMHAECAGLGVTSTLHIGQFPKPASDLVTVIVSPHEHALARQTPEQRQPLLSRTIAVSRAAPGTKEAEIDLEIGRQSAARFATDFRLSQEWSLHGAHTHHFPPGYASQLDLIGATDSKPSKDIDVFWLGAKESGADFPQLAMRLAAQLPGANLHFGPVVGANGRAPKGSELGSARRALFHRCKIVLDVHRGDSAFDWDLATEAVLAGAVVVTEHSRDIAPFKPGEHVISGDRERLGYLSAALLADEQQRQKIHESAYELLRSAPPLASSVAFIVGEAWEIIVRNWYGNLAA